MDEEKHKSPLDDLYGDFDNFDLGQTVERLKAENKKLTNQIIQKDADIKKLADTLVEMKTLNQSLTNNISSLFATARTELERKDNIIADLRRERDNIAFRRKGINTNHINSIEQHNKVHSEEKNQGNNAELCNTNNIMMKHPNYLGRHENSTDHHIQQKEVFDYTQPNSEVTTCQGEGENRWNHQLELPVPNFLEENSLETYINERPRNTYQERYKHLDQYDQRYENKEKPKDCQYHTSRSRFKNYRDDRKDRRRDYLDYRRNEEFHRHDDQKKWEDNYDNFSKRRYDPRTEGRDAYKRNTSRNRENRRSYSPGREKSEESWDNLRNDPRKYNKDARKRTASRNRENGKSRSPDTKIPEEKLEHSRNYDSKQCNSRPTTYKRNSSRNRVNRKSPDRDEPSRKGENPKKETKNKNKKVPKAVDKSEKRLQQRSLTPPVEDLAEKLRREIEECEAEERKTEKEKQNQNLTSNNKPANNYFTEQLDCILNDIVDEIKINNVVDPNIENKIDKPEFSEKDKVKCLVPEEEIKKMFDSPSIDEINKDEVIEKLESKKTKKNRDILKSKQRENDTVNELDIFGGEDDSFNLLVLDECDSPSTYRNCDNEPQSKQEYKSEQFEEETKNDHRTSENSKKTKRKKIKKEKVDMRIIFGDESMDMSTECPKSTKDTSKEHAFGDSEKMKEQVEETTEKTKKGKQKKLDVDEVYSKKLNKRRTSRDVPDSFTENAADINEGYKRTPEPTELPEQEDDKCKNSTFEKETEIESTPLTNDTAQEPKDSHCNIERKSENKIIIFSDVILTPSKIKLQEAKTTVINELKSGKLHDITSMEICDAIQSIKENEEHNNTEEHNIATLQSEIQEKHTNSSKLISKKGRLLERYASEENNSRRNVELVNSEESISSAPSVDTVIYVEKDEKKSASPNREDDEVSRENHSNLLKRKLEENNNTHSEDKNAATLQINPPKKRKINFIVSENEDENSSEKTETAVIDKHKNAEAKQCTRRSVRLSSRERMVKVTEETKPNAIEKKTRGKRRNEELIEETVDTKKVINTSDEGIITEPTRDVKTNDKEVNNANTCLERNSKCEIDRNEENNTNQQDPNSLAQHNGEVSSNEKITSETDFDHSIKHVTPEHKIIHEESNDINVEKTDRHHVDLTKGGIEVAVSSGGFKNADLEGKKSFSPGNTEKIDLELPKPRKRITPTPVKDFPASSFTNMFEKNNSAFSNTSESNTTTMNVSEKNNTVKLYSRNVAMETHFSEDGEIPILHLEDLSFSNMDSQKPFDKSILRLLDCMNVSNLDCDMSKSTDTENKVSQKENLTFKNVMNVINTTQSPSTLDTDNVDVNNVNKDGSDNIIANKTSPKQNLPSLVTSTPKREASDYLGSTESKVHRINGQSTAVSGEFARPIVASDKNVNSTTSVKSQINNVPSSTISAPARFRRRCRIIAVRKE